ERPAAGNAVPEAAAAIRLSPKRQRRVHSNPALTLRAQTGRGGFPFRRNFAKMGMSAAPRPGFLRLERPTAIGKGQGTLTAPLHRCVGHLRRWSDPLRAAGPTDRQLLGRFAADRDEAAFAELLRRHGPLVLGVARRVLANAHDAEDVLQAVF